jgi:hypothetical protein
MALTLRIATLLGLSVALGFAGNWSGSLVDSKCYASEERNVNPTDTLTNVDRDRNEEIRFCSPSSKTKSFAVVQSDGQSVNLDSAGDAKASDLVPKTGKRHFLRVVITGEMIGKVIKVDSISVTRQR